MMRWGVAERGLGSFRRARVSGAALALVTAVMVFVSSGCGGGKQATQGASSSTPPPEAKHQLHIHGGVVVAADRKPYVDRLQSETVQWKNEDDVGCTIVFGNQGWPFEEPPQIIYIAKNQPSAIFRVVPGTPKSFYSYSVYQLGLAVGSGGLPLGKATDGGPPDPPTMDVGP